mgnify:FL=1
MKVEQHLSADGGKPFEDIEDIGELRRIATYFRDMAKTNGARLLIAETNASRNRQLLEQKTRGFSLLSRMSSDFLATAELTYLTKILAGHLTSILNMNRTAVLSRDSSQGDFRILASSGYSDADQRRLIRQDFRLPRHIDEAGRMVSTLSPLAESDRQAFAALEIPYFIAIPITADDGIRAVIVTGRLREQRPFSPPLNVSDVDTLKAIGGFFGAYLTRHRMIERDREQSRNRIGEVERLVAQRTAEIERQRELLDESLKKLHETQQQLIVREKLASLGQLVAGIAHEIRNPLNFINNFSDLSLELVVEIEEFIEEFLIEAPADRREELSDLIKTLHSNLGIIGNHGKRAASIVRNMLQHSRGDKGRTEIVDLNGILTESIEFAYHVERAQNKNFEVTITRDLDPTIGMLNLVPQQVSRAFVNLISNAFSALKKRQIETNVAYQPTLAITSHRLDQHVEVRLRDNGVGIAASIRPQIFNPFFTTKSSGEGTGLGLSLCYDIIVNAHGGGIEIDSVENDFTEVTVRLPLAAVPPRLGHKSP